MGPPRDIPARDEWVLTHVGSAGTWLQHKIFMVKAMLEMASAVLVCSI